MLLLPEHLRETSICPESHNDFIVSKTLCKKAEFCFDASSFSADCCFLLLVLVLIDYYYFLSFLHLSVSVFKASQMEGGSTCLKKSTLL